VFAYLAKKNYDILNIESMWNFCLHINRFITGGESWGFQYTNIKQHSMQKKICRFTLLQANTDVKIRSQTFMFVFPPTHKLIMYHDNVSSDTALPVKEFWQRNLQWSWNTMLTHQIKLHVNSSFYLPWKIISRGHIFKLWKIFWRL
jgi:hypothetical protein